MRNIEEIKKNIDYWESEVQEALKRIPILMQELKENTNKEPKQIEEVKELEELES